MKQEHELALTDAIARFADLSDGESGMLCSVLFEFEYIIFACSRTTFSSLFHALCSTHSFLDILFPFWWSLMTDEGGRFLHGQALDRE